MEDIIVAVLTLFFQFVELFPPFIGIYVLFGTPIIATYCLMALVAYPFYVFTSYGDKRHREQIDDWNARQDAIVINTFGPPIK